MARFIACSVAVVAGVVGATAPAWGESSTSSSSSRASTGAVSNEEALPLYLADFRDPWRLVVGVDFGLGLIDSPCAGCSPLGGLSANGFFGVQVSRRVAILVEAFSVLHLLASDRNQSGVATHTMGTLAARVWLTPELWLEAGVGGGRVDSTGRSDIPSWTGPAAVIAIGGEPGHRRCWGIDLSLRVGGSWLGDTNDRELLYNVAALVGTHWN